MYASLSYIQSRHPYGEIPGQPSQVPQAVPESAPNSAALRTNGEQSQQLSTQRQPGPQQERPPTPPPEEPEKFNTALRQLAQDLVIKEQQIEYLINSLPGIGSSEADQEKRMRELEVELRQVERERVEAESEKERMVDMLGQMIVGVKRVP